MYINGFQLLFKKLVKDNVFKNWQCFVYYAAYNKFCFRFYCNVKEIKVICEAHYSVNAFRALPCV